MTINQSKGAKYMAKGMTKAQMQQKIDELEERLNTSNESYLELLKRYGELNEKKGDVIGYEQLKDSFGQLEKRYEALRTLYDGTVEREKKRNDSLTEKYVKLQEEYDALQKKSLGINKNKMDTGEVKDVNKYLHFIQPGEIDDVEKIEKVSELNNILSQVGVSLELEEHRAENDIYTSLAIRYNPQKIKEKLKRNAGRKGSVITGDWTVGQIRERMKQGETAEDIAKELGVSRATLFRKLKEAEDRTSKNLY